MIEYYVSIDFLHYPTLSVTVNANDEAGAIAAAIEKAGRGGAMYRNATTYAQPMSQRNAEIRAHRKEEAESGNI